MNNSNKIFNEISLTYLGILIFFIGTITSFAVIIYMAVIQLNLSDPQKLRSVYTIMGAGILLIFSGINVFFRSEKKYVLPIITLQTLSSMAAVVYFYVYFPESLHYPSIGNLIFLYSLGILMLTGSLFFNVKRVAGEKGTEEAFIINEDLKPINYWTIEENNKIGEIIQSEVSNLIVKGEEIKANLEKEERNTKSNIKKLLLSSVNVVDTFESIFKKIEPKRSNVDQQTKIWLGNFQNIKRLSEIILSDAGVSRIETPNGMAILEWHTIVGTQKIPELEDYMIIEEVEKGYRWQGEILRKSSVIVVKNSD